MIKWIVRILLSLLLVTALASTLLFTRVGGRVVVQTLCHLSHYTSSVRLQAKGVDGTVASGFSFERVEVFYGPSESILLESALLQWNLADLMQFTTYVDLYENIRFSSNSLRFGEFQFEVTTDLDEKGSPSIHVSCEEGAVTLSLEKDESEGTYFIIDGFYTSDDLSRLDLTGRLFLDVDGSTPVAAQFVLKDKDAGSITIKSQYHVESDATQVVTVRFDGAAPKIVSQYLPPDHSLEGTISGDLEWKKAPSSDFHLQGSSDLSNLIYSNELTGVVYTGSQCEVLYSDGLAEASLSASTSGDGEITCAASCSFSDLTIQSGTASINFNQALLVDRRDLSVIVSGALLMTHSAQPSLSGVLTTDLIEFNEPDVSLAPLPQLNIVGSDLAEAPPSEEIQLDIDLNIPDNWYVSARGATLQLGGALKLEGSNESPLLTGTIQAKRGSLALLGQNFLVTDCNITCTGQDIQSHFVAETKKANDHFFLEVQATNLKANFLLRSDPHYPEDELLSKLLFGKDFSKITPFELAKLTYSIEQLRNPTSENWNPSNQIRRAMGLHYLSLESVDSNHIHLSTGTFIRDNLFIGLKKDITGKDDQLFVEYHLSDQITAEASAKSTDPSRISLSWSKEY